MADISIRMTADGSAVVSAVQQSNAALQSLGVQAERVSASMQSTAKSAVSSFTDLAKGMLLGTAVGLSFDAFKGKIMSTVDSMAQLKTMSERTNASVENLSKISGVARAAGSDMDTVSMAISKMSKGMAGADDETKGAGAALEYLGISAKDSAGNLKDPAAMFSEVSKQLTLYQDGAGKAAIAQALFGNASAQILPTLKLLGESGDQVAKVTDEQATAARQYARDISKLDGEKNQLVKTITVAVLPTMSDFANVLLDASKNTNVVNGEVKKLAQDHSIEDWADFGAMALAALIDVVKVLPAIFSVASAGVMDVVARAKIAALTFVGTSEEYSAAVKAQAQTQADMGDKIGAYLQKEVDATQRAMRAKIDSRKEAQQAATKELSAAAAAEAAKPKLNYSTAKPDKLGKSTAEQISDYEKLRRSIMEKQSTDDLQLVTSNALTESDKIRAKMQADLASGAIKLTAAEVTQTGAALEKLKATEKIIAEEKAYQEFIKARYESSSKLVNAAVEEADKNEALAKTFGMTKAAIEDLEIARLQEQLTSLQGVNQTTAEIAKLEALIDAKKRNRDAVGKLDTLETSAKAAKQAEEDWKKTSESINASLTDALMRGFESGKDFASNMRDTIVNAFKTMVLRPVISAIMSPVTAVGAALGGMGSAANAAGIGGSTASLFSTGSALAQMGSLFPEASSAVLGFTNAAAAGVQSMVGITGTSAQMVTSLTQAGYAGTSAAGAAAGSAFASAIPYIGAAVLAYSLLTQDHGTPTSNTGSTARAFDAAGNVTGSESYYGGTSAGADAMIVKMQDAYMQGAKSLGIATVASNFNFSGNTGKNGESPNFALGGGAGGKSFQQTEIKLDDAAVALAASRAVFAALQGSELPTYLAGVFDHLSAGAATQEQITAALAGAQALAAWHTALTALPFDSLTNASYSTMQALISASGGLDKLGANLASYYANFYSAGEKSQQTTDNVQQAFSALGLVMPEISAQTKTLYRAEVERLMALDQSIPANAQALAGALSLNTAVSDLANAFQTSVASARSAIATLNGLSSNDANLFSAKAAASAAWAAFKELVPNAAISSVDVLKTIDMSNGGDFQTGYNAKQQQAIVEALQTAAAVYSLERSTTPAVASAVSTTPSSAGSTSVDSATSTANAGVDALAQSLKALGATSATLSIDLLRAQGLESEAVAAQRAIDIAGYGAAEIAIYDYNASLRAQITAIGAAKTATEALIATEKAAAEARAALVQSTFDTANTNAKSALDALSRAVDAEKKLVATAYESASKTAQTALDKITTSVGKLQALATSLKSALDGLRIAGSDSAYRQDAQLQIRSALETARAGGGLPVDGALTSALATVAKPSEQLFGSFTEYALDFYRTANDIADLTGLTSDALSADETTQLILQNQLMALKTGFDAESAQLDAVVTGAQAQLNALNGINTSVLSVASALENFAASMGAATTAAAALAAQKAAAALAAQKAAALAGTPVFDTSTKSDVVSQIQNAAAASGITQEMQLYQTATSSGYTAAQVDKSMGWAPGTSNAWAAEKGLPTFAIGTNFVPNDMTANIHAGERIIPAADNRELMQRLQNPGDNNAALVTEIRALRAEVAGLRASSERGNESAQRTADTLAGRQGVPFLVQIAS